MQGWLSGCWWMTALPQLFNPFREGSQQKKVYVIPEDDEWVYVEKENERGRMVTPHTLYKITTEELSARQLSRLWIYRDYEELLEEIAEQKDISIRYAALIYGELNLPTYGKDSQEIEFSHCAQLGLVRKS